MIRCRKCDRHHLPSASVCPFCGQSGTGLGRVSLTATAALSSVVLMACYGAPGFGYEREPAYMDYACSEEQLADPAVVKCCLPDGMDTAETTATTEDTSASVPETCEPLEEMLGAGERCCPTDSTAE